MSRTWTVLVLFVTTTIAGCCMPRVNVNVDGNAVSDAKKIVSRVTRDVGTDNGGSRRR